MRFASLLAVAAGSVLLWSCESDGGEPQAGAAGAGAGAGGCAGLSEEACAPDPDCAVVRGLPFAHVPVASRGSTGSDPWWEGPFEEYVGCTASDSVGPDAQSCTYDPAHPSACFYLPSGIGPEGWTVVVDCDPEPSGCGDGGIGGGAP